MYSLFTPNSPAHSALLTLAPAIPLATAGAIASLSAFAVPVLQSYTNDSTKDAVLALAKQESSSLFSVGSKTFPPLAFASTALLLTSSYSAHSVDNEKRNLYALAAVLCVGIAPFTSMYMVPACNAALIKAAEQKNGVSKVGGELEVRKLMRKFAVLNYWRAALMGAGGLVGLWASNM